MSFDIVSPFDIRAAAERARIRNPHVLATFDKVCERVDRVRLEKIKANPRDPRPSFQRYLDIAYWLAKFSRSAVDQGLHVGAKRSIVDIGAGGGHYGAVCQALGHEVVGVDLPETPLYADLCELFGVERILEPISLGKPLPFGKADLINAVGVCFDYVFLPVEEGEPEARLYWTPEEWASFLEVLRGNLRPNGVVWLNLNRQPPERRDDAAILAALAGLGAQVDYVRLRAVLDTSQPGPAH